MFNFFIGWIPKNFISTRFYSKAKVKNVDRNLNRHFILFRVQTAENECRFLLQLDSEEANRILTVKVEKRRIRSSRQRLVEFQIAIGSHASDCCRPSNFRQIFKKIGSKDAHLNSTGQVRNQIGMGSVLKDVPVKDFFYLVPLQTSHAFCLFHVVSQKYFMAVDHLSQDAQATHSVYLL